MKVLVLGNYPADQQVSMKAFCDVLTDALRRAGAEVLVVKPRRVFGGHGVHGLSKWFGYLDKFCLFPLYLAFKSFSVDRIHVCDHSNAMYVWMLFWRKVTVSCHDVIAIQAARGEISGWHVGRFGKVFQRLILAGLNRAAAVVCVSELTLRDLLRISPGIASRCSVAPNPLNFDFHPDEAWAQTEVCGIRLEHIGPYMLHVGSDLPRKNRQAVLDVWLELRRMPRFAGLKLVIVGPKLSDALSRRVSEAGECYDDVLFLSGVSGQQLRAIYSGAKFFFFPSLNEGFGWPVAEAQACGCPVFASNIAPMPEVGADAARYFDPTQINEAVSVICNADLPQMRSKGLENVARFDVALFGGRMYEVLKNV